MQFNTLYGDSGYPRRIRRDFLRFDDNDTVAQAEEESIDNTLDQFRCRERCRYDGTTIVGSISEIEDSCSSRYRRLTLRVQTTF